jgi:UDP-N-acetylmuramyl pentapeptide phosphotransferase/UDP-N-acetylglucosamine-1-phosphate transferase
MVQTAFCLLVAIAGWYYLFSSTSVQKLAVTEGDQLNQRRIRLRRAGGAIMFLLAVAFYSLFQAIEHARPAQAMALLMTVLVLLATIILLALLDLRLTLKLRRHDRGRSLP